MFSAIGGTGRCVGAAGSKESFASRIGASTKISPSLSLKDFQEQDGDHAFGRVFGYTIKDFEWQGPFKAYRFVIEASVDLKFVSRIDKILELCVTVQSAKRRI